METEVFFFSGTGNSLTVAKELSRRLQASLRSISAAVRQEHVVTEASAIVVVFPSYLAQLYGVPLVVERFLTRLENIASKTIFTVCTCGGHQCVNALPTVKNLSKLVKSLGGRVRAEYSVRLPMNNLDYEHIPVPIQTDHELMISRSRRRIDVISRRILKQKRTSFRAVKALFHFLMTPLYRAVRGTCVRALREQSKEPENSSLDFRELIPLTDRSISVDETCTGCGICEKVCPVQNIRLVDGKPVWNHRCEMCFACDEWCPAAAVHHWGRKNGVKYHHPEIKVSDMVRQSTGAV